MKYALLLLSALALFGAALLTGEPAHAAPAVQAAATPLATPAAPNNTGTTGNGQTGTGGVPVAPPGTPGSQGNDAPPGPGGGAAVDQGTGSVGASGGRNPAAVPAPANLVGPEPNMAVGYFPAVIMPLGIIGAMIAAFVSIRRDGQKAKRTQRKPNTEAETVTTQLPPL